MDKLISYGFVLAFMAGLIWLTVRYVRKAERAEAKLETSEAENETIIENQKAKYANIHMVNNLDEPERAKLRKKWERK